MKIGISLSNYGQLPSRNFLKNTTFEIENQGLDSVWVSDHIIVPKNDQPWTRVYESVTTLGFLASITDKIQLGFSIILVPLRNPFVLAKQIATLDSLSNGRVLLGVGIGWNKKEFDLIGCNFEKRAQTLADDIKTMKDVWSGKYFEKGFLSEPQPVSENGPPILIGGQSRSSLKRVAFIGDGWHPVGISSTQYDSGIREIRELAKRDYLWSLRINFVANKEIESEYTGTDGGKRLRLVGNTDQIISQIQEYRQIGLQHLVCDIRAESEQEYFEQLKIIGEIKKSF